MARTVVDLFFTSKTTNIDQFDVFVFSVVGLLKIFELRVQILGIVSPNRKDCYVFLPDFLIWCKSTKNKFYFEVQLEA